VAIKAIGRKKFQQDGKKTYEQSNDRLWAKPNVTISCKHRQVVAVWVRLSALTLTPPMIAAIAVRYWEWYRQVSGYIGQLVYK
jgi:hypothetical protein